VSARVVRLGSPRQPGEGLRIGTVRRPPRGIRKAEFATRNYFDVWFPDLAPAAASIARLKSGTGPSAWTAFVRRYRSEMARPGPSRVLDLLAALSQSADFSMGCYCEDEARCHRSVLAELLHERGARFAAG
jgi:uncharacterized protein YeaO (DUF488 family)